MTGFKRSILWVIAILIFSLPVILPLTKPNYFPSHDGEWAVVRLAEMNREIKDLQIPPRWSDFLNHGFGYPLFLFTYPFPYYLGAVLHLFGFGLIDSIKLLFIISVIFSGIFMFLLGKELEGDTAGFIAAALYMYAPFRLVDIYVRGSIGESLSFVLFPLLFWLSLKLAQTRNFLYLVFTSASFAVLIMTHNVMALIFAPIWLVFLFISVKFYYEDIGKYIFRYFIPTILLGLGLSAYFWLPAIMEKKYIILSQIPLSDISQNFIQPIELFNSTWNYGIRPSFQLGWVHILLFIVGVVVLLTEKGLERKKNLFLGSYMMLSIAGLILMTLHISYPLWKLPFLSSIDFPWRLLGPIVFFLSLGTMFAVDRKIIKYFSIGFIIIAFFLIPNFAKPAGLILKNDDYYRNIDATTTSADELMPLWVSFKPKDRYKNKVEIDGGNGLITSLVYNSGQIKFTSISNASIRLRVNSIYFPGWVYKSDGQLVDINYSNPGGIVIFELPPGTHNITANFTETPIRIWSDVISLLSSVLALSLLAIYALPRLKNKFV